MGRPKVNWLIETAKNAWRKYILYETVEGRLEERHIELNYKNERHVRHLIEEAKQGIF